MLFDIRTIVAALLGLYGAILVFAGLVYDTAEQEAKTGGWNVNLWAGIGMLVVGAIFATWVIVRPVQVPPSTEDVEADGSGADSSH